MSNKQHEVQAKSDPEFKPDTTKEHVFDAEKGVYRLVEKADKPDEKLLAQ